MHIAMTDDDYGVCVLYADVQQVLPVSTLGGIDTLSGMLASTSVTTVKHIIIIIVCLRVYAGCERLTAEAMVAKHSFEGWSFYPPDVL